MHSLINYIMLILRGNLLKALRDKYFDNAMDNGKDFEGWKQDGAHEVKAKTWESVDITCLLPVLIVGIYCIANHLTDEGVYSVTKLNESFDFPVL